LDREDWSARQEHPVRLALEVRKEFKAWLAQPVPLARSDPADPRV
jgi:hypothetical protein